MGGWVRERVSYRLVGGGGGRIKGQRMFWKGGGGHAMFTSESPEKCVYFLMKCESSD